MKKQEVIDFITEKINKGVWKEGDRIYSEYQLQKALGVSCGTARAALKDLASANIIETVHGSGSYVKANIDNKKKKTILILTNENIANLINSNYRQLVNYMKEDIIQKGYTPICYARNVFSLTDSLSDKIDDICGVLSLYPEKEDKTFFKKRNIPIVNPIRSYPEPEPSVVVDYVRFLQKVKKFLEKYKLNSGLIFTVQQDPKTKEFKESIVFYSIEKIFELYNVYPVNESSEQYVNEILMKQKKAPKCIVFFDDNIYKFALPTLSYNKEFYKNTKIITHYSETDTPPMPNTCKLIFDMKEVSKKSVELLIKLINKQTINDYNIFIKPIVEGEENLK